jgi:DNA-binding GntR family transcriptional regulator
MAEPVSLEPAPPSLTDQATAALRRAILSTRVAPGETISESGAGALLGLGKAPIRAALARLADEGLVQALPRRGWMVSPVTVRDIHEVFALRALLEPEAARLAAGRVDAAALERLDAVCRCGYDPSDPESALAFLEANTAFHVAIAELGGNRRLARTLARLLDEATRLLVLGLSSRDRTGEMRAEHGALIAALVSGDGAAAAKAVAAEIETSRGMVLAALLRPDAETRVGA